MNKTLIFRKIGGIISEITEQYQYLAENPENINPLELELFIANSNFLAEHLAILKKLDGNTYQLQAGPPVQQISETGVSQEEDELNVDDAANPVTQVFEPVIVNQGSETIPATEDGSEGSWFQLVESEPEELFSETIVFEQIAKDNPVEQPEESREEEVLPVQIVNDFIEPQIPEVKEVVQVKEPVEEVVQVKEPVLFNNPEAVKPATEGRAPTLNEILSAAKRGEPAISTIKQQEIKDLKSMIRLNDKLMFVRDLFSGYSLAYNEAIEVINRFDNFESADRFLQQNYAAKNRWAEKQGSVDQFYEILSKRFS